MKKLVEKIKGICDKIVRHKFYKLIRERFSDFTTNKIVV